MTAGEFKRQLEQDRNYVTMMEEKQRHIDQNVRRFNAAAAPLKLELAQVGFPVEDLGRLFFKFRPEHSVFIPILIKWLPRIDYIEVKDTIVRLLTDGLARPVAARPLIEEFKRSPVTNEPRLLHYKWAIGNALSVVADDSVFEEIVELIRDERHCWSRDMLPLAFQRMKDPRVVDVLIDVLDQDPGGTGRDAGLTRTAIRALGNKKASRAKDKIRKFLSHPEPLVRKEAEKSLEKIARAEEKARDKRRNA
jgi:hypothetical protein